MTEAIVAIIEPSVRRAEIERARRKRPDNLGAYDLFLRALPHAYSAMPDDAAIAIRHLAEALRLDPDYAAAHAVMAVCHESLYRGGDLAQADRTAGIRHARLALALGTDDAASLAYAAMTVLHLAGDFEAAASAIARAQSLNASCATALYWGAHVHAWSGDTALAEDYANRALRLSPFDPLSYEGHVALGAVRMREGRYQDAASHFGKAAQENPRFSAMYALHAAALALAGRVEDAKAVARRLLEVHPTFRLGPFQEFAARFVEKRMYESLSAGFHQAGLPE
jgi:tetratricopeptide (TPR) repeat protein